MRVQDLIIDPRRSLGNKLWLCNVMPAFEYKNGSRTDNIVAYRYEIALPERNLDKISVRIDGQQLLEAPNGFVEVKLEGLELSIYWSNGNYQVGAKATGISVINSKA